MARVTKRPATVPPREPVRSAFVQRCESAQRVEMATRGRDRASGPRDDRIERGKTRRALRRERGRRSRRVHDRELAPAPSGRGIVGTRWRARSGCAPSAGDRVEESARQRVLCVESPRSAHRQGARGRSERPARARRPDAASVECKGHVAGIDIGRHNDGDVAGAQGRTSATPDRRRRRVRREEHQLYAGGEGFRRPQLFPARGTRTDAGRSSSALARRAGETSPRPLDRGARARTERASKRERAGARPIVGRRDRGSPRAGPPGDGVINVGRAGYSRCMLASADPPQTLGQLVELTNQRGDGAWPELVDDGQTKSVSSSSMTREVDETSAPSSMSTIDDVTRLPIGRRGPDCARRIAKRARGGRCESGGEPRSQPRLAGVSHGAGAHTGLDGRQIGQTNSAFALRPALLACRAARGDAGHVVHRRALRAPPSPRQAP